MNSNLLHTAFALMMLAAGHAASAATYYVADCQSGAVAGCAAGSDSNAGTNPNAPWKTTAKVLSRFSTMAAGDKILFAKGGAWSNAAMTSLRNLNSSTANPITFDSYQPTWYTGNAKPILVEARRDNILFDFSGGTVANGGYVVRNLDLRGVRSPVLGTAGIWVGAHINGLTVENVSIRDFVTGFGCGDGGKNVVLRNSKITYNRFSGVFGGCHNWLVDNNIFDNNGYNLDPDYDEPYRNHSIYFASPADLVTTGVTIRNNTFTNSVKFKGVCQGVVIVAHGRLNNIVIEDNLIDESANVGPNKGGCWGIAISPAYDYAERMDNVTIRRNRIANVGGIGIEVGACINCTIENNVIVKNDGADGIGIQAPGGTPNEDPELPPDADMGKLTIRNNSLYFANNASSWGSTGIQVSQGRDVVMTSNLIYFATAHAHHSCFTSDNTFPALPKSRFDAYDNNLCFRAGNAGRYSQAYLNLADARRAGFDTNGSNAHPQLAVTPVAGNKYSMALLSGSPAVGAGHATHSAATDIDKATRNDPDIGAFEFPGSAATVPGAPKSVSAALVAGTTQAKITIVPPLKDGRRPINGYIVTSIPAGPVDSNPGALSLTHTMIGLKRGVSYTFTVQAKNSIGTGAASPASNAVKAP